MARSIWKGSITFGMVSIPSKLYSATSDQDVSLHQYHKACNSRVKQPRYCPTCEAFLETSDITKGYELSDGSFVPLSEGDLASLPLKSIKKIDVVEFVTADQLDVRGIVKSYFVGVGEPEGHKAYKLLLLAMATANLVAVAKLGYREKEHLTIIRPYHGVLLLQTLLYPVDLRPYEEFKPQEYPISDKEEEMAVALVKAMASDDFHLENYENEYQKALQTLIEAKAAGETLPTAEEETAPVADVAEALLASLKLVGEKVAVK